MLHKTALCLSFCAPISFNMLAQSPSVASSWSPISYIGGTPIKIPTPSGFAPVTPDMKLVYNWQVQFISPRNSQLGFFISEHEIVQALKNELPMMRRSFRIAITKDASAAKVLVSDKDFASLVSAINADNQKYSAELLAQMPELLKSPNQNIEKIFKMNPKKSVLQLVVLPVHISTKDAVSYSTFSKATRANKAGGVDTTIVCATATIVHIKKKLAYLYCYGGENDLEWTRKNAKLWTEAILAVNQSPRGTGYTAPVIKNTLWNGLFGRTVSFFAFGVLAGFFKFFYRKNKLKNISLD